MNFNKKKISKKSPVNLLKLNAQLCHSGYCVQRGTATVLVIRQMCIIKTRLFFHIGLKLVYQKLSKKHLSCTSMPIAALPQCRDSSPGDFRLKIRIVPLFYQNPRSASRICFENATEMILMLHCFLSSSKYSNLAVK